ncbi:MAG: class I SAM-dependent methyltransferase [Cytophagales bacterium]|nr:class I SAM-dependent methyltransferase [Cytophagales bacterium]
MKFIISYVLRKIPRSYLQLFGYIAVKVVAPFFIGNKVECPVCKSRFRKFLPYGRVKPRENALCPHCLSLERHRLMWLYLEKRTNFFHPLRRAVLHIAPERCFIKRFEAISTIDYITADLESPWAKIKMDIHDIPFEENTFDVIFCNHVLEHVDDDKKAMRELCRVLKPDGWAIMQPFINTKLEKTYEDPAITTPKEREKAYWQADHLRMYGLDYKERLENEGFSVKVDDFAKGLGMDLIKRYGLVEGEKVYVCTKAHGT